MIFSIKQEVFIQTWTQYSCWHEVFLNGIQSQIIRIDIKDYIISWYDTHVLISWVPI